MESFFAAMEAGADAVYCGLHEFSARAKAQNFSLTEMENLCAYAHKQGRKLYIPLNTLIKESELPRLIHVLEGIARCQPDGLIIQDLGVYRLVHDFFPEIPLHASTQMAVHNSGGVQMLEEMGFERAVLARELTLTEIKKIRAETSIELEHFIHGALCYSISGHCLFSSFQTGRSGNRGGCAQPCRRRYNQNKQDLFTFSTSDFSTLPHLHTLAENGVMSFKIEGRMKNAEYVWNVVRAYREVLDCHEDDRAHALKKAETILSKCQGRQTSSGFLTGKRTAILLPKQKGGIGTPAGVIENGAGKTITFTTKTGLHIGDTLRVQPKTDQPGTSFTIRQIHMGKKGLKQAKQGQKITLQTPFFNRFNTGDHVFKTSTGRGFTLSREACLRRLTTAPQTPAPVQLSITCSEETLTVSSTTPVGLAQSYGVETYPAQKSPLSRETLENIFKKTVHPELSLAKLQADNLPPVVIKPSLLKKIRRDFYDKLSSALGEKKKNRARIRQDTLQLVLQAKPSNKPDTSPLLFVQTEQAHSDLVEQTDLSLILPVGAPLVHGHDCIWDIPAILYPETWLKTVEQVKQKLHHGQCRFRINNIGHCRLFSPEDKVQLMAGAALYSLNLQSIQAMEALGISFFTTSPEDDSSNIKAICAGSGAIIVQIYGTITLMTSRIPLGAESPIHSKNETFQLEDSGDLTRIQANSPLSLTGHLHELQAMGAYGYLIDIQNHSTKQRHQILQSIRRDTPITPSTLFNFQRGLV
jgi:putative protease